METAPKAKRIWKRDSVRKYFARLVNRKNPAWGLYNTIHSFTERGHSFMVFSYPPIREEIEYMARIGLFGPAESIDRQYVVLVNKEKTAMRFRPEPKGGNNIYILDVSDYPYDIN